MKCKYKKFLKAAYIDYEEDYCSNAVLRKTRPSLEEILAPATFEITSDMLDAIDDGYYWFTFYTSMANYQAPDGVLVLKVNLNGTQFIRLDIEDGIINKGQGVVLRSSTDSITLTKTYSKSSDDYSNNSLIGTDYLITNPGNAYRLYDVPLKGLGFYPVSSTGKIKANKAYLIMPITYLTQWQIVGNSEVHTEPYLTSWKVSGNSEVHTLPYPDGVVLPNGYKRCEYLESDGTAYMELDSVFDTSDEITVKCALNTISGWRGCVATKNWNTPNGTRFLMASVATDNNDNTKQIFSVALYTGGYGNPFDPYIEADTDVHVWNYNGAGLFSIDDTYTKQFNYQPFTTDKIVLFRGHNSSTKCKIYDFLQVKGNNTYHLIPCLDSNDTPCMYDVINNQAYYNSAGSGSFTYKLYPQPTEIWSCGDLGPDGKYHVKISNGVTIFDIPLSEPLRKVNGVADTIEFPSGTEGKALVTRNLGGAIISNLNWILSAYSHFCLNVALPIKPISSAKVVPNILIEGFTTYSYDDLNANKYPYGCTFSYNNNTLCLYDDSFYEETQKTQEFTDYIAGKKIIYELATPTTELIDVSPFSVSPTDTYTSANVVPYSAFEHTENKEIWSCGEYNATDGKYHILVQPLGGSIADIALDEPLRKVNDVADTIDLMYGTIDLVMIRRRLASFSTDRLEVWKVALDRVSGQYFCYTTFFCTNGVKYPSTTLPNLLCNKINTVVKWREGPSYNGECIMVSGNRICVNNAAIEGTVESYQSYLDSLGAIEIIYPLATLTQELVILSPIEEADSYSCVISQGGKAVSWSNFETE